MLLDERDQGAHLRRVEDERGAGGREQLGQRLRRAEREGAAVRRQRARVIAEGVAPDLQRGELRDAVLHVIERVQEYVELAMPARPPLGLEARPVDARVEARVDAEPRGVTGVAIVARAARIEPVLERV